MQIQVFSEEMLPGVCAECHGSPSGQMVRLQAGRTSLWLHRRPCANRTGHLLVALTESSVHTRVPVRLTEEEEE